MGVARGGGLRDREHPRGAGEDRLDRPREPVEDLIAGRGQHLLPGVAGGERRGLVATADGHRDDLAQQRGLGREREVDGALAGTRRARDRAHRRGGIAVAQDERRGGVADPPAGLLRAPLARGRAVRALDGRFAHWLQWHCSDSRTVANHRSEGLRTSAATKQLVARLHTDVLNIGNLAPIDELIHPDYVNHEAAPGTPPGRDGFRHTVAFLRGGFPDLRFVIEDMLAEDDRVVVRSRFEGTHDGTFLGMPPTGRRVWIQHIHIFRVQDDMVAEHWACRDDIGGFRQLGTQPRSA